MPADQVRLRIVAPTEPILPGRGFYQLEEDALYVQVGVFSSRRRFFSYLENDLLRLDFDRAGRLIFFELSVPRRQWPVDPGLELPPAIEPADLRWLDFRGPISVPALATDPPRTLLRLTFAAGPPVRHYFLGQDVFASVDDCDALVHLWIRDIVDDLAGQEIGAFRKKHRSHRSFFAG